MRLNRSAGPAAIALSTSLTLGSLAKAEQPRADWMPAQQVIESVIKSGYTQVTKLEADDGRGKARASRTATRWNFMPTQKRASSPSKDSIAEG